jgi:hypothetical protein
MALFLFAASNKDVVRGVGQLAEVPFDRIVESVDKFFAALRNGELAKFTSTLQGRLTP